MGLKLAEKGFGNGNLTGESTGADWLAAAAFAAGTGLQCS